MSKAVPFDRDAARQDIERRNQLRPESHLPVLDIDSELKRLAQVHNESEFEQFIDSSALYHRAMRRGRYRYTERNHGTFHFITDGMELQNCIRRGMAKRREEITRCTARALVIQPPPPLNNTITAPIIRRIRRQGGGSGISGRAVEGELGARSPFALGLATTAALTPIRRMIDAHEQGRQR